MKYYLETIEKVIEELKSSENGLSQEEASKRLKENGPNKLEEGEKKTFIQKFIDAIKDPMIIMLLAAALLSAGTTFYQNMTMGTNESYADLIVILFVVTINTFLGIFQENKAEHAIDALKQMTAAQSKVLRDNKTEIVKAEDLVVGDVILLEAGDAVPADCRIIDSHSLQVEEAALTGESVPVNKIIDLIMLKENALDIPLGDRTNMLYSGSTVVYGRGKAIVTGTAMDTEVGKIAGALSLEEDEKTPLQKKMSELSKTLTKLVIGICIFVFAFGIFRQVTTGNTNIFNVVLNTFILAVALAVAAIPEGLPAVVTIILSIGVTAMAKRQALVRKLTAVETLGCTQIICSDKTGTLTQNKMTVVDTYGFDVNLLAKGMALCSDATLDEGNTEAKGEPTEVALVNFAYSQNMPRYELIKQEPRIGEAPFDSMRKMMSTVHQKENGFIQYTKGATEILLEHCDNYLDKDNNRVPMTFDKKNEILSQVKQYADRALRVLGLAIREYDNKPDSFDASNLEEHLCFVGFVGMIDPCRPEVFDAINKCRKAGIRPVMITGDHIDTAVAIGKDLKIIKDASEARIGAEIDNMDDEQMVEAVLNTSVWARVQPEHKTRIVKTLKSLDNVVAMTGDGVNDAPSIKASDIGVGMGITGTDVTKGVSDLVLADDNFATIVNAVEEGRKIYDNVRKVLQFQLSTNMSEVLVVFIGSVLGLEILSPAHLLWINMVTDSAPGLALGMEKAEEGIMDKKPRSSDESVFSGGAGVDMVIQGIFMASLIVLSYFVGHYIEHGALDFADVVRNGSKDGMTMAFLTCNFVEIFHAICMRSQRGSIFKLKTMNWWLIGAFLLSTILTAAILYIPALSNLFGFASVSLDEFIISFLIALSVIPIIEIAKIFLRKIDNKKEH